MPRKAEPRNLRPRCDHKRPREGRRKWNTTPTATCRVYRPRTNPHPQTEAPNMPPPPPTNRGNDATAWCQTALKVVGPGKPGGREPTPTDHQSEGLWVGQGTSSQRVMTPSRISTKRCPTSLYTCMYCLCFNVCRSAEGQTPKSPTPL
jgi:hypothetical protein